MNPFTYSKANSASQANEQIRKHSAGSTGWGAKYIAGGTNLIDLMRETIERPVHLVDLNHLGLKKIERKADGSLSLGALVSNAHTAYNEDVKKSHPLLSDAILAGASPQLRNMATNGGNLLQRTRCYYFYDKATKCNKREPGTGCDAIRGYNRIHAVLGQSDSCIAVHPSDMCVALAALDAAIRVVGDGAERTIPMRDFHQLPGATPQIETSLAPGELIVGIDLPATPFNENYAYLKVRDRSSYAFALVSAGVGLEIEAGKIKRVQAAMGGVAHKPWRDFEAEKLLVGRAPTKGSFQIFADSFFSKAKAYEHNAFKPELGRRVLVRALTEAFERGQTK